MICHSSQASSTLKPSAPPQAAAAETTLTSNLGTMVINDDDTMKRHDTGPSQGYKPEFMAHFEKKEQPSSAADSMVGGGQTSQPESSSEEVTVTPEQQNQPAPHAG